MGARDLPELFPGYEAITVETTGAEILLRTEGARPLLLHGYPETHVMWHRVAAALGGGGAGRDRRHAVAFSDS